jgi:hypothetical protein
MSKAKTEKMEVTGGKSWAWLQTLRAESSATVTLEMATTALTNVDKSREQLIKSYGKDHATMCMDLSDAMTAWSGSADQKKTAKRSLKRAMRRASNARFTFAFKGDRCEVTPYEESKKDGIDRAFDSLAEHVPESTIQAMKAIFLTGVEEWRTDLEQCKARARALNKAANDAQEQDDNDTAVAYLKRAGLEATADNIALIRQTLVAGGRAVK